MRVLFVSSEIYPLAKTGGLADVSAALPAALAALGVEIRLMLPGYPKAIASAANKSVEVELADFMGAGPMRLISARTPDTALPIWLVDCPSLFRRSGGPYQDGDGQDWPDNAKRFAVFNHVAAQLSLGLLANWRADIVHANDWHSGLVAAILAGGSGQRPATVLTVHNLAFQGLFPADLYPQLGLPGDSLMPDGLEFYGNISFLKAGLTYSDRLTTVSPTYAREILTAEYGFWLEGLLQRRAKDLVGIRNGADYRIWDPAIDAHLPAKFNLQNIAGKRVCKTALQVELGLEVDSEAADVIVETLPRIIENGAQCAVVGDGDRLLERRFELAARQHPGRIAVRIGYEEPLAHRVLAGGDILLHPARFEPCGLTQLYAMRYGTLPVVRNTGGLCDTVVDATDRSVRQGTATGFAFESVNSADMLHCIERALALYSQPFTWRKVQRQAMSQDFGWSESARRYLALYHDLAPDAAVTSAAMADDPVPDKASG